MGVTCCMSVDWVGWQRNPHWELNSGRNEVRNQPPTTQPPYSDPDPQLQHSLSFNSQAIKPQFNPLSDPNLILILNSILILDPWTGFCFGFLLDHRTSKTSPNHFSLSLYPLLVLSTDLLALILQVPSSCSFISSWFRRFWIL